MTLLETDTKYLDLVEQICYQTEQFSLMTLEMFIVKHDKKYLTKDDKYIYLNYSWGRFFVEFLPALCYDFFGNNSLITLVKEEITLNCFKVAASQNKDDLYHFRNKLINALNNFIEPAINCYSRNLYRIESKTSLESLSYGGGTNLFIYFCLTYRDQYALFNKEHQLEDPDLNNLSDSIRTLQEWKNTILHGLASLNTEYNSPSNTSSEDEEISNIPYDDSITRPHLYKENYDQTDLDNNNTHSSTDNETNLDVESRLTPTELTTKELDLSVKVLIARQSGILNGTFHTLPTEKQYNILALLFNKSRGNVKNTINALIGKVNSDRNPANSPAIVEKTNELIRTKELGIAPVIGRKES